MHRLSLLVSPPQSADFLSSLHHASHALFTPRYIGIVGGGMLLVLFVAAAMVENSTKAVPALQNNIPQTQSAVQPQNTPSVDTLTQNSNASSQNQTKLQVNGQNVPVPPNSDTTQTITSGNTKTVIHTSDNSSRSANSNSSDVTINVDSVTSGGT